MDQYTATEQAYKNGYEQGRLDAAENKVGLQFCDKCKYKLRCDECIYNEKDITKLLAEERKDAENETVKMLAKGLIDFIQNGTFRKGCELKKVERKVREIAKAYGVKIDDGE